jgi:uncharacterized protein (DUF1778 family)
MVRTMAKEPQISRFEASLPTEMLARVERAAAIQGRTLADFVVAAAPEAACRAIAEADLVRVAVAVADQQRIAEALVNAPACAPALEQAFRRRCELFDP